MPFNSRAEALRSSADLSNSSRRRVSDEAQPRRSRRGGNNNTQSTASTRHYDGKRNNNRDIRRARLPSAASEASSLCLQMREICAELRRDQVEISGNCKEQIHTVMEAWINHKRWTREEADLAVTILKNRELTADDKPKLHDFTSVINAFAKVPACCVAADNILNYMEDTGRPEIRPDRVTINTVIGALAKSGRPGSAQRAEMLLRRLEKDYADGDTTRRPNVKSYGKVIDAYARANDLRRACSILEHLEKQFLEGKSVVEPTVHMYTSVIDGFVKSGRRDAAEQAERVLQLLLELFDQCGTIALRPDAVIFSTVINAWSKSKYPQRSDRALAILKDMESRGLEIDLLTYNSVLNVLASTGQQEDLTEAEELLQFLVDSPDLIPDSYSFNTVLKAYANMSMGCKAERLVQRWRSLYLDGRVDDKPDCQSYKTIITCWARTNVEGSGQKAQAILDWMEENHVTPNTHVYNGVLTAWARSTDSNAATRVQEIWDRMPEHDRHSYPSYLNAIFRTGNYKQICEAEEWMKQAVSDRLLKPDVKLCNTMLGGYAQCGDASAIHRAHGILEWMPLVGLKPDTICYNTVLGVYKLLPCHEDRAENAMRLFREEKHAKPSTVTYTVMAELCEGHDDYLMELFEDCIRRGMLDKRLATSFRKMGPPLVVEQLEKEIPFEWQCNASRGPAGLSQKMIKCERVRSKRGTGMEVDRWGW